MYSTTPSLLSSNRCALRRAITSLSPSTSLILVVASLQMWAKAGFRALPAQVVSTQNPGEKGHCATKLRCPQAGFQALLETELLCITQTWKQCRWVSRQSVSSRGILRAHNQTHKGSFHHFLVCMQSRQFDKNNYK